MRTLSLAVSLFLVAGLVPFSASPVAASGHRESAEDDAGDAAPLFGGGFGGAPENALSKEVDIVEVFVENESATGVTVGLIVAGFDPGRDSTRETFQAPSYSLRFALSSDSDAEWTAATGGCFLGCEDYLFNFWRLCRSYEGEDEFSSRCYSVGWPMEVDMAAGRIAFPLDRQVLADVGETEPARAGDTLTLLSASSQGAGFMRDDWNPAEDDGLEFEFESDTANQALQLSFVGEDESDAAEEIYESGYLWKPVYTFGVLPGGQIVLPLAVENTFGSKKIVDLVVEMDAADGSLWNVTYPAQVVVPAQDTVVANLVIGVKDGVAHRSAAAFTIQATPIGEPTVIGMAEALVQATVTPSPAANVLHFHAMRGHYFGLAGLEDVLAQASPDTFSFRWGALNVLDQDPTYADEDVAVLGPDSSQYWFWAGLDTPLASDLRFDLEKEIVMDVTLLGKYVTTSVRVEANLFVGETHIGGSATTVDVGTAAQVVPLSFLPRLDTDTVSALEGTMYVVLRFSDQGPTGVNPFGFGFFSDASALPTVYFRPADSKITLPLLPVAKSELKVSSGQYLVSLDLKEGKEPEEYVNPGRGLLYNLSIGNQGTVDDTVLVSLNRSGTEGWLITIGQTKKARLAPGEFTNVTVVVRAPSGAKEGERAAFEVIATSLGDPEAKATMKLNVIATKGVDIPDETFAPPLGLKSNGKKKDSPLGGEIALAAGLLAVLLVGRRRKV